MYNINNDADMIPQSLDHSSPRDHRNSSRGRESWIGKSPHALRFDSPYSNTTSAHGSRFGGNSSAYGSPYQRFPNRGKQRSWPHFVVNSPGTLYGSPRFDSFDNSSNSCSSSQPSSRFTSPTSQSRFAYKSPQINTSLNSSSGYRKSGEMHRNSSASPYTSSSSEEFDVRAYVIPAMTSNPWADLEKQYFADLAQKQHS